MIKNLLIIFFACSFNSFCLAQSFGSTEQSSKDKKETVAASNSKLTLAKSNSASIYPNPASGAAQVKYILDPQVRDAKIVIYNILGNVVKEVELSKTSTEVDISVQSMTPGVYFYSLELDGVKQSTKRLVIK